jgi:dienelactone hydrolase
MISPPISLLDQHHPLDGRDVNKKQWFTNPTPESEKLKTAFFGKAFDFPQVIKDLLDFTAAAKSKWSGVSSWGAFGLCWGGKVAVLTSAENTPFTASGQVHPGKMEIADAKALTIPHIVLASNGEPEDVVKEYHDLLVGEGKPNGMYLLGLMGWRHLLTGNGIVVETYGTMHHGWMGARAKLQEEANLKEYTRG